MTPETFESRLNTGRSNHHIYRMADTEGKVSVWKYEQNYILTWEECPTGRQYDDSTYTRDERHTFDSLAALLSFLSEYNLSPEDFRP